MDSLLHISLIALPLRALFVPIGFESVRIDPNALFGEIERMRQEKQDQEFEDFQLKKEFLYFSDKTVENQFMEMNVSKRVEAIVNDADLNEEKKRDIPIQVYETAFMQCDESKISLIPVVFDVNNRSIITKGLEVKGMIPFNIPRKIEQKGLLLERYEHVAYHEDRVLTLDAATEMKRKEYIALCNELSRYLAMKRNVKSETQIMNLPAQMFETAKRYYQECEINETNQYRMFMLLKDLLDLKLSKEEEREMFTISSCIDGSKLNSDGTILNELLIKYSLSTDLIALVQTNERLIRPLLDTVLENHNDRSNFRMIEINPSMHLFAPRIIQSLKSSFVGNLNLDYTYANTGKQIISKDMEGLNLKSIEWNQGTNAFLNDINSVDFLIYRLTDSTIENWKIEKQLESFYDCLKVSSVEGAMKMCSILLMMLL